MVKYFFVSEVHLIYRLSQNVNSKGVYTIRTQRYTYETKLHAFFVREFIFVFTVSPQNKIRPKRSSLCVKTMLKAFQD